MKAPDWLKGDIITGLLTIIGTIVGTEVLKREQEKEKPTAGEAIGIALNKMFQLDRGEFLHGLNLINSSTNGGVEALLKLFNELESKNGLISVAGKWYREEWVTRKLLMIPPKYRATEYPWLSALLEQDQGRIQFFSKLEILNNDGWLQIIRQIKAIVKEKMEKMPIAKTDFKKLDRKTAKLINRLDHWLDTKGVR